MKIHKFNSGGTKYSFEYENMDDLKEYLTEIAGTRKSITQAVIGELTRDIAKLLRDIARGKGKGIMMYGSDTPEQLAEKMKRLSAPTVLPSWIKNGGPVTEKSTKTVDETLATIKGE